MTALYMSSKGPIEIDKMVLTYNFHESTETITFGELQDVLPNGFRGSDMDLASEPETCLNTRSDVFL